jgi:hypothetical protein
MVTLGERLVRRTETGVARTPELHGAAIAGESFIFVAYRAENLKLR